MAQIQIDESHARRVIASEDTRFEDKWAIIRPFVLKILRPEPYHLTPHFLTPEETEYYYYYVHFLTLKNTMNTMMEKTYMKLVLDALREDTTDSIEQAQRRILSHEDDDRALLEAYIREWNVFFAQCEYLSGPFRSFEELIFEKRARISTGTVRKGNSIVRKLMLDPWNDIIFENIKHRLLDCAMKLVNSERNGDEAFDSKLVIGIRESYVNLCSDLEDELLTYRDNFEKAYIDATEAFYKTKASEFLRVNGVENYMTYAETKSREEKKLAQKYLESCGNSIELLTNCCEQVLVTAFKDTILAERPEMIKNNDTQSE